MLKKTQKKVLHFTMLVVAVCIFFGLQTEFVPLEGAKLNPDTITSIMSVDITNSLMSMWGAMILILVFAFFATRKAGIIPTKTQVVAEVIIEFFFDKLKMGFGGDEKEAKKYLPAILTVFLIIFFSNQFGLLPFLGSIVTENGPLFRTPTADFSLTIALALLLVGIGHFTAFTRAPIRHILNFVKIDLIFKIRKPSDIANVALELFLGILDIIGEIAKVLSMSARLFGNLVAGDLMIMIIGSLAFFTAYLLPMPFTFLSAFSGVVQSVVFCLLGLQFICGTVKSVPNNNNK